MSVHNIMLQVNGQPRSVAGLPAARLLVDLLRDRLQLTGTCNLLALQAEGAQIETVEGLATINTWHPLQLAFSQHHALQCGFCTPGLLMRAEAMRREGYSTDPLQVRQALGGNLCRCTGYQGIVDAVCQVLASDATRRPAG